MMFNRLWEIQPFTSHPYEKVPAMYGRTGDGLGKCRSPRDENNRSGSMPMRSLIEGPNLGTYDCKHFGNVLQETRVSCATKFIDNMYRTVFQDFHTGLGCVYAPHCRLVLPLIVSLLVYNWELVSCGCGFYLNRCCFSPWVWLYPAVVG